MLYNYIEYVIKTRKICYIIQKMLYKYKIMLYKLRYINYVIKIRK
jgi:hypothetical protein